MDRHKAIILMIFPMHNHHTISKEVLPRIR
ncbi:unnamed protein product [Cylicostephanus goldi]|uniref:Uncharacterized protein n=1 Tax=Cylicostephanus goldi TaxID=71465 RepID=A0A3P7NTG4_CYLGO|nr:unnamed protein product [Cylicostephanus goldi]